MKSKPKDVVAYLQNVYTTARSLYPEAISNWRKISLKVSASPSICVLSPQIQMIGYIDVICRSIEDSLKEVLNEDDIMISMLSVQYSTIWVSQSYAIHHVIARRSLLPEKLKSWYKDISRLRVQIEKFEPRTQGIPKQSLKKVELIPIPTLPDDKPHAYDFTERNSAMLFPSGRTPTGSMAWVVVDPGATEQRILSRRQLADDVIAAWLVDSPRP